jgi:hypothetical protein
VRRVSARGLAEGVLAALRAPLWLRGERLTSLMDAPPGEPSESPVPKGATGAAFLALRILGGVPKSPWRSTCLYRSIAECLILRRHGVPAVMRIGVRNEGPPGHAIVAHAWVVRAAQGGGAPAPTRDDLLHSLLVRG